MIIKTELHLQTESSVKQFEPNMPVSMCKEQTNGTQRIGIVSAIQSSAPRATGFASNQALLLKKNELAPYAHFLDFAASSSSKSAISKAKQTTGKQGSRPTVEPENARRFPVDPANDVSMSTPHVGQRTMSLNTPQSSHSPAIATSLARAPSNGATVATSENPSMMHANENSTQMNSESKKTSNDLTSIPALDPPEKFQDM
jgi:hypothetical protein